MDRKPNKAEVESRLHQTAEAMSDRLASLQDEVSTTGVSLRNWIVENPLKSVGGMLAAGLAVGVLFGGQRSTRRREHQKLVDTYLDALRAEAEAEVEAGTEPGPALEKALRDRVPLVVYRTRKQSHASSSWGKDLFWEGVQVLFSTGLSLLAREAIEGLLTGLDVEGRVEEEVAE